MSKFVRINIGTNKALLELVFMALETMGYQGVAGVKTNCARYVGNGVATSVWVPTTSKYGVTYSEVTWNGTGDYAGAPVIGLDVAPKSVQLNSEYTAVVSADKRTVKVGCQDIPATKVDELYKALHS